METPCPLRLTHWDNLIDKGDDGLEYDVYKGVDLSTVFEFYWEPKGKVPGWYGKRRICKDFNKNPFI
jgi:hypothetical protein